MRGIEQVRALVDEQCIVRFMFHDGEYHCEVQQFTGKPRISVEGSASSMQGALSKAYALWKDVEEVKSW